MISWPLRTYLNPHILVQLKWLYQWQRQCQLLKCRLHSPIFQVFSLFLEILPDFISTYKEYIEEWLYVLMTQLLKKMGADLLGSVQAKVIKAMQTTRYHDIAFVMINRCVCCYLSPFLTESLSRQSSNSLFSHATLLIKRKHLTLKLKLHCCITFWN